MKNSLKPIPHEIHIPAFCYKHISCRSFEGKSGECVYSWFCQGWLRNTYSEELNGID